MLNVLKEFFGSVQHGHAYEITTATSAGEAFAVVRGEKFDLILLDVVVPATQRRWLVRFDLGLALMSRFRELGVTAPVLAMSASSGVFATEADALSAGAAGFLLKPVNLRELAYAVAVTLEKRP